MPEESSDRDLGRLLIPALGRLLDTGDRWRPYALVDGAGVTIEPVAEYFADLQAAHASAATLRSYGIDLLRWWRFLAAVEVEWDRASRIEARDFSLWMQLADKPVRPHWRRRGDGGSDLESSTPRPSTPRSGNVNAVTGKPVLGSKYSRRTQAHCETVLRGFYDFHLAQGTGPIINPFPLARARRTRGRPNAHHNPMDEFKHERTGRYRPTLVKQAPKRVPDERFDALFAGLSSHRDRALLVFWVTTGARASELLGARQCDASPGDQTIAVVRKGSRATQLLPASPDAFVWLRLYQEQARRAGVPIGRQEPLWWTLRRPWRPLSYDAARAMFRRVNESLGANWTLHDLRHTAAYRMAQDPEMRITDVQHILGHALLSTSQIYLNPSQDEVIAAGLAFHARRATRHGNCAPANPSYNPATLENLFGRPT